MFLITIKTSALSEALFKLLAKEGLLARIDVDFELAARRLSADARQALSNYFYKIQSEDTSPEALLAENEILEKKGYLAQYLRAVDSVPVDSKRLLSRLDKIGDQTVLCSSLSRAEATRMQTRVDIITGNYNKNDP